MKVKGKIIFSSKSRSTSNYAEGMGEERLSILLVFRPKSFIIS